MSFRTAAAGAALLAALALAGCSDTVSSLAPDTAPPLSPRGTTARLKAGGKIVLDWAPNTEADLAGYNVYAVGPMTRLNSTLIQSPYFILTPNSPGDHYFRVTAVDRSGNESAPSAMVRVLAAVDTRDNWSGSGAEGHR